MTALNSVRVRALERKSGSTAGRDHFERDASHASRASGSVNLSAVGADHLARQGGRVTPALQTQLGAGARLDPGIRSQMEGRLGFEFAKVRIHTGGPAAATNARMHSNAYTKGTDIAFARERYQPNSASGRELLAHELAHVVQQRTYESVQLDDASPMGGDVLTVNWDIQFKLDRPTPREMSATPDVVLTGSGLSSLGLVRAMLLSNPNLDAELEGNASIEGPPEHNQQLSERRARYIAQRLGVARVRDVPNRPHTCTPLEDGLFACGTMHSHSTVDPSDRRVSVSMFTPPEIGKKHFPWPDPIKPNPITPDPNKPTGSNQWSLAAGIGYTGHRYLTRPGPSDPANEAVIQLVAAYTRQIHLQGQSGPEFQVPVQLQVSLTTGAVSIAGGAQLSYVIPFGNDKWQWSAFAQALGGGAFSSGSSSLQFQPSIGTQITFQPLEWLQLQGQASAGFTVQTGGPSSFDYGGVFIIQFVK